jgi:hypothetical protein
MTLKMVCMQYMGLTAKLALLGYYAGGSDNSLPMFQDNLSVPSP